MKKKNIVIAFAMLLLTGVALSTASYAWFTANTQIQLGDIDVHVSATNGIQVSTDGVNWKSSLSTDELRNAYYEGSVTQFPDYVTGNQDFLQPVSTDGTINAGKFDMFYGELGDGAITLSQATEANGKCMTGTGEGATEVGTVHTPEDCTTPNVWVDDPNGYFIAFDLFIQSSAAAAVEVGLLPTSSVATTGTEALLSSSIRVGFLNNGYSTAVATALAKNDGTEYTIWEPNANKHTDIALGRGAVDGNILSYKGATATGTNVVVDNTTNFADTPVQPAGGAGRMLYTNATGANYALSNTGLNAAFPTANEWNTTTYPTVFSVNQGINKIRTYVWIEGQDVDCENTATLGGSVKVAIRLNAKQA